LAGIGLNFLSELTDKDAKVLPFVAIVRSPNGLEEPAMPTYEYHCKKCGMTFEHNEQIAKHEKSHPRCPKCKSGAVEPVLADFYAMTSKKT